MKNTDAHTHLSNVSDSEIVICNSAKPSDWSNVVHMSNKSGGRVRGAIGVHPWYVSDLPTDWQRVLSDYLSANPNLSIGEIGLDKYYPDMQAQQEIFVSQLKMAHNFQRGISVHCVGAWDKMLHLLKVCRNEMPSFILFHSYSGPVSEIAKLAREYNAYFSYGIHSLRNTADILHTPLNRILIESDDFDVKISEVLLRVSEILSVAPEKMSDIIYNNIKRMLLHAKTT